MGRFQVISNRYKSPADHEIKFVFENSRVSILIKWLELRCIPDPEFPTGRVSSIYYDTLNWQFLNEKMNSDYLKTKIRIRWYENIEGGKQGERSFLEAKYKIGASRKKQRLKTDLSGKWLSKIQLNDPELTQIPFLLCSLGVKIPSLLFPAFQISYNRFRFVEPVTRSRLCVDYDIGVPRTNWQMMPKINPIKLKNGVFEIKGPITELPDVLGQMTALGCRKESFSKYGSCYMKLIQIRE